MDVGVAVATGMVDCRREQRWGEGDGRAEIMKDVVADCLGTKTLVLIVAGANVQEDGGNEGVDMVISGVGEIAWVGHGGWGVGAWEMMYKS